MRTLRKQLHKCPCVIGVLTSPHATPVRSFADTSTTSAYPKTTINVRSTRSHRCSILLAKQQLLFEAQAHLLMCCATSQWQFVIRVPCQHWAWHDVEVTLTCAGNMYHTSKMWRTIAVPAACGTARIFHCIFHSEKFVAAQPWQVLYENTSKQKERPGDDENFRTAIKRLMFSLWLPACA